MFGCLGMHMIVNLLHTKVPKCRLSFGLYPLLIHCLIDTICFPQPDILIIHIPTALALTTDLIDTICFPQPDILMIHIPTALASAPTTD